jgi:uncharacterized protein
MPNLDLERSATGPLVQAFSGKGFRVDGVVHATGLKLTPVAAIAWVAPVFADLVPDDLADLVALSPPPEFLILGTGATLRRPARALVAAIEGRGIGIEIMDSRAAARAWGVLRGEGRWVAAALLPLDQP